jgi:hypothetical protein
MGTGWETWDTDTNTHRAAPIMSSSPESMITLSHAAQVVAELVGCPDPDSGPASVVVTIRDSCPDLEEAHLVALNACLDVMAAASWRLDTHPADAWAWLQTFAVLSLLVDLWGHPSLSKFPSVWRALEPKVASFRDLIARPEVWALVPDLPVALAPVPNTALPLAVLLSPRPTSV